MWTIIKYYFFSLRPWGVLFFISLGVFYHQYATMEGNYIAYSLFTIYSYFFVFVSAKRGEKLKVVTTNLPITEFKIWIAKSISFVLFSLAQLAIVIALDDYILGEKINLLNHFKEVIVTGYFLAFLISKYKIRDCRNIKRLTASILLLPIMFVIFALVITRSNDFYDSNNLEVLNYLSLSIFLFPLAVINSFDFISFKLIR